MVINMANPLSLDDPSSVSKQGQKNRKQPNPLNPLKVPPCDQSRMAVVDVAIMIVVISACVVLVFPYIDLFYHGFFEILGVVKYEFYRAPMVYACFGLSILFAMVAVWGIYKCTYRKCGNPNCRGLRNAPEFDIQLETEECLKNSSSSLAKGGNENWMFELNQEKHKELEAELRKIAPPNGKAILLFRGTCGCSVGKMEVPASGPKKPRKIKK